MTFIYKKLKGIDIFNLKQEYSCVKDWSESLGVYYSDIVSTNKICYQVISGSLSFQFNDRNLYSKFYHIVTINEGERVEIDKDVVYSFIIGNVYGSDKLFYTKYYIADNSM